MIGDIFLNNTFPALPKMRNSAREAKRPAPYVYNYYNITCLTQNPLSANENTTSRVHNALVQGLNEQNVMPRIIIMITDLDILRFLNFFGFGESHVIGEALNWLLINCERSIKSKHEEYRKKKPGALVAGEPKMIWLGIPERPMYDHKFTPAIRKFNCILADLVEKKENNEYLSISDHLGLTQANYHQFFKLSGRGETSFWQAIDGAIEEFDVLRAQEKDKDQGCDDHEDLRTISIDENKKPQIKVVPLSRKNKD